MTQEQVSWAILTLSVLTVFTRLIIVPLFIWDGRLAEANTREFDKRDAARRSA